LIRVILPAHLRALARINGEVHLELDTPVTQRTVLDELETQYPMLAGTMRDHDSQQRRPFVRFYACQEDLSNDSPDEELPAAVTNGTEPYLIVGAMAGG
jgi:hypothetical protein